MRCNASALHREVGERMSLISLNTPPRKQALPIGLRGRRDHAVEKGEKEKNMKITQLLAVTGVVLCVAGCASTPKSALVQPVGPTPAAGPSGPTYGWLQVYSAREPAESDPNRAEWLLDESTYVNDDSWHEPAHTDYTVYSQNDRLVERVRNNKQPEDAHPALVALPPGIYKIQAQAEEGAEENTDLIIPVLIEHGKTTVVHLEGNWKPAGSYSNSDVVRLPNGQIAGWRAPTKADSN
jgi:hypothetical protein